MEKGPTLNGRFKNIWSNKSCVQRKQTSKYSSIWRGVCWKPKLAWGVKIMYSISIILTKFTFRFTDDRNIFLMRINLTQTSARMLKSRWWRDCIMSFKRFNHCCSNACIDLQFYVQSSHHMYIHICAKNRRDKRIERYIY